MYIKENIVRLIIILMVIIFAGGVFLSITFFKKELSMATSPSQDIVKNNSMNFDKETYDKVLKKLMP